MLAFFDVANCIKEGDRVLVSVLLMPLIPPLTKILRSRVFTLLVLLVLMTSAIYYKGFNFDVALNYKNPTFKQGFIETTKNGINLYWDNVGGEMLELTRGQASDFATIIICGCISIYNKTEVPVEIRNYIHIVTKRLNIRGFISIDHLKIFGQARTECATWLETGKLKANSIIVTGKIEKAPQTLANLFKDVNTGK